MPVLVTGAETGLGRACLDALLPGGGEVRAYLDPEGGGVDADERLRRRGVKVAVGAIDDEGHLELALEQVHTVVHCWGGPLTTPDEELDGLAGVLSAALGAGCRRFVWASHLGAAAPDGNAYLQACAEGEGLLVDATIESVVIRRALTYGSDDELTLRLRGAAGAAVRAEARHNPLAVSDLAAAVATADRMDRGAVRADLAIVVELAGPTTMSVGELRGVLGPAGGGPLPPWTVDLYGRDLLPGEHTLGRDGTPVRGVDRGFA